MIGVGEVGGVGWGEGERAKVMHDSIQKLVVVQTFRLSRGQPLPPLGDMQNPTKTATVPGRRLDSAPPRYRCKAKVKPVPTIRGPPGQGPAASLWGTKCRDPPPP